MTLPKCIDSGYELVRMASEVVEELISDGSAPVVILKLIRQDDGTCEMLVVRPDIVAERDHYKQALESIAATEPEARVGVDWTHWRQQARTALALGQERRDA